jgi:hypothetical protein
MKMKLRSTRLAIAGLFLFTASAMASAQNVGLCLAKPRHTNSPKPQTLRYANSGKCWNPNLKDHQILFVCGSSGPCHYALVKTTAPKQK